MKSTHAFPAATLLILAACSREAANEAQQAGPPANAVTAKADQSMVAPQARPSGDITFASVLPLRQDPGSEAPMLRNGVVATTRDWPASLYATFPTPGGTAACTAALVGPRAILTAAHCTPVSGRISIRFGGATYGAACTLHPQYSAGDASADFALCKLEGEITAVPSGFRFETISLSSLDQMLNRQILLTGYGCISDVVANGQTDGLYRIGANTIDETSNSPGRRRGPTYYAGSEDNNLFTRDDPALANLCPGDSGGPAFRATAGNGSAFGSRSIVGVNSRVFYRDQSRTSYGSSLVSATGGPEFEAWARAWTRSAQVQVCGVGATLQTCRT
jgi:trypsin